ncbi:sugar phosphate nucleotidyltransferase [Micromonospora sp. NPDC050417]|uniref:sugar phosphate nucleotidyltransferase n=1 Tax=Micromonospora sp. NPDC050417 TaxID=3364280 RepID=UPI0037A81E4B
MVSKAVIAVAGFGSRFFPVAKTLNKCMLPILTKPVVQYMIEDCINAGVTQIAIVTAPGQAGEQVRHYFSPDPDTEAYFHGRGWDKKWEPAARLHELANFTFLEQPRDGRYGTAVPAMIARDFVGDDDFLLLGGDDVLLRADGGSDLADLVQRRDGAGTPGAIAAVTVDGREAYKYGILTTTRRGERDILDDIVEKPTDYSQPTGYINISRCLVSADFFGYLDKLTPSATNGEYQNTDALVAYGRDHDILVSSVTGAYHDCGNVTGWLAANNAAAQLEYRQTH